MNTSDAITHAANGIESLVLMVLCEAMAFASQECPGDGASPITEMMMQMK